MGQEILYCSKCQTQLRSSDFEKQKAYRIHGVVSCFRCAREQVRSLPPETVRQLIEQIATQEDAAEKKRSSTSRILRAADVSAPRPPSFRSVRPVSPKTLGLAGGLVVAAGIGLALTLGALMSTSSGPRETLRGSSPQAPLPPSEPDRRGASPVPAAPEAPTPERKASTGTFEAEASESLRRARDFAKKNPEDLSGQMGFYEKAVWDSSGTALLDPAKRELDDLKKKDRERALKELPELLDQAQSTAGREEFGRALSSLEQGRKRHAGNEWTGPIEKALQEIRGRAAGLYPSLRESALAAARSRASNDLQSIRDRVLKWNLEEWRIDLEQQLGRLSVPANPPASKEAPPPPLTPEAARIRKSWGAAMDFASARDYDTACRELEKLASTVSDPAQRKEFSSEVETIRLAAGLLKESVQALAAWPKDQRLRVAYFDERGDPATLDGFVERVDASRIELRKEKKSLTIELGELQGGTLAEAYKRRPNRIPSSEARALGAFFLLEGDAPSARTLLGESSSLIPEKVWDWAEQSGRSRQIPDAARRELEARTRFYAAERDYTYFPSRADAALRFRQLQSEFADTAFIRRNAASIRERGEGPKEYFFLSDDLRTGGTFKSSEGKLGSCWTSDSDSTPSTRKNNFAEFEFSVMREASYRCWIYVGGCCAETLSFYVQGSELRWTTPDSQTSVAVEPGDSAFAPVKFNVGNGPRTHAQHGGKKQPSRWGWAEIPLPRYAGTGPKTLRIMTDQQGFSVAYALVASVRRAAPTEGELKDLVRTARASSSAPLESGLVGHWMFDEGKGTVAADASPHQITGTLINGPVWAEGKIGGALSFGASNSAVSTPAVPPLADLGPLSVSAWIKPTKLGLGRVVSKEDAGRGRWMLIAGDKSIGFAKDFATQELRRETVAGLLTLGVWQHVAATWNGTASAAQIHIYVNGVEPSYSVNQDGTGVKMPDASLPLFIGNRGDLTRGFHGVIDDVRIYQRVLSASEIMTLSTLKAK